MNTQRTALLLTLLAIAMWLTLSSPPRKTSEPLRETDSQSGQDLVQHLDSLPSPLQRARPASMDGRGRNDRQQLEDELLDSLSVSLNPALESAIADEVEKEFATFLVALDVDSARHRLLTAALSSAYSEIRLVEAAMMQGEISGEDIARLRNPNHVLDSLAPLLDSDELTLLETTLENRARGDFDLASVSQLEAEIPELDAADRKRVLDTLFHETYALTSPDGLAMGGVVDQLELQMQALDNAQLILSGSLPQSEMDAVSGFLEAKRRALAAAAIIFDR